ncbi:MULTISPECIES: SDR family oxidoreductase [unclassified Nitrosovibrio]|uniref:SDR family oxidoreductase n=1 Tax=unclassified Nitrosovibrio TaxID=2624428 RepID=UPI0008B1E521|nr:MULTISPECIES: SDR family oxidoreductase [unclassified Nitrosovibrio]SEP26740.1 NADP-dependent 3-hydroxy acid dehydrogenase YdfG [Nitrosovibrio sp. Nv6]SOD39968.1 NADP-dependent 3-hydroxy acid dehydrogenase YdfG [Nitrosovibrio sp. Nv4]
MSQQSVTDKVAIVTGAGQGLGEAIANTLGAAGAIVCACDIKEDQVKSVVQAINDAGGTAYSYLLDVRNEDDVRQTVDDIMAEHGRVDVLINNAGTDVTLSIEDLSIADWERVVEVNLHGPFLLSKAIYPLLKRQGKGHIVNVTSTAAKRVWTEATAYHASKWGLLGFSHALHAEGRRDNIKVTAVVAGGMRTPFIMERFPDTDPNVLQDPKNVAETVHFVLTQPDETVIPEVMVLPMRETSWP